MSDKKQQLYPLDFSQKAGWYLDPWDLSGKGDQQRWWTGLIWSTRTRKKPNLTDRDNKSDNLHKD